MKQAVSTPINQKKPVQKFYFINQQTFFIHETQDFSKYRLNDLQFV